MAMLAYPAKDYEFFVCSQSTDGPLAPPVGDGWILISTNAAEDPVDGGENGETAAVLIATWARPKAPPVSVEASPEKDS